MKLTYKTWDSDVMPYIRRVADECGVDILCYGSTEYGNDLFFSMCRESFWLFAAGEISVDEVKSKALAIIRNHAGV